MKASVLPFTEPSFSSTVKRSVRICTGWPPSVRPLITGTSQYAANSSMRASAKVRIITTSQ